MNGEGQVEAVIGQKAFDDVEKMLKLLDTAEQKIVDVNNTVRNLTLEVKGAKSVEDLATKSNKLQQETAQLIQTTADYKKIAAETNQVLHEVSGTQSENLRLYAQYKAQLASNREEQSKLGKELKAGSVTLEEYKSKMAALVGQEQQAKIAQGELTATIKAGIKEEQAAAGSIDQMAQRLGQLKDAYRRMSDEERKSAGGKALLSAIQELDPAVKELDGSMGNFQRNVGNYPRTMGGAATVLDDTRKKLMQQVGTVKEGSQAHQVLSAQIDHLNTVLDSNATKYLSARTASRELENVSRELATELGLESEAFKTVSKVAGDFKNDVGDVQATIKALSSDTTSLDGVIGAAQGLAGMFSIATSATSLLGSENEEMEKSMQKLMAVMVLMQGLQQVQNTLQAESTAMIFLNNVQQKAKATWQGLVNFVMTGNIATTAAQTAATEINTAATVRGTVALRAFRVAALATGIGFLLVLLASTASAMDSYSDSTEKAGKDTKETTEETEKFVQALNSVVEATEKVRNARAGGLDSLKRELDLMKARGDSAADIQKKEQELIQSELSNMRTRAFTLKSAIEDGRKRNQDTSKLEAELVEINKQGLDKRNEAEVSAAAYQKTIREKQEADNKKAHEKRVQESEKLQKKLEDIRERDRKAAAEILQLSMRQQADGYKQMADDETEALEVRLHASALYYAKEADLITAKAAAAKEEKGKTAKEILLVEAQAESDLYKLKNDAADAQLAITKGYLGEEVELRKRGVQLLQENIDTQEQAELRTLTDGLKKGTLTVEQYEKERSKIKDKFSRKRLRETVDYLEEEITALRAAGADTTDLEERLNEARNALYNEDVENFEEATRKKEEAQRRLDQKLEELGREIFSTFVAMQQAAFQSDIADVDKRIADVDRAKDAEIKAANASGATQVEKQRRIAKAEAEAQAKRETLEARKRQIQLQQARFEKAANVAAIIMETSLAVIKTLREFPGPAGLALAAVIGAIGAVQLARALSAPLPQYWKGRKNGPAEFAVVGERGPEIVRHKDGTSYLTPGKPTVTFLPEGATVTPNHELNRMEQDGRKQTQQTAREAESQDAFFKNHYTPMRMALEIPVVSSTAFYERIIRTAQAATVQSTTAQTLSRAVVAANTNSRASETALAKVYENAAAQIVDAISNRPEYHTSITESGFRTMVRNGDVWTEYLKGNT